MSSKEHAFKKPKKIIQDLESENGNVMEVTAASDIIRNRRQVYNARNRCTNKSKIANTGIVHTDFTKLVSMMSSNEFLKDVSFTPTKCGVEVKTFSATDTSLGWISKFCSPDAINKAQLHIDMTYKVGPYYTTCCSLKHPYFTFKEKPNKHPTLLAALITSTSRKTDDYQYLATQLKKKTKLKSLIYGTDGELALEKGMKDSFEENSSIKLRCFTHVENDMKQYLAK